MNEVLQKFFLLVVVVAFLSHVSALMPAISYGKVMQDSQVIVSTKLKDVSQSDIERVIKEAEIALDSIPAILGIDGYKKDIKIKIVEKGPCRTTRDKIVLLGVWFVKNKRAPIVHEVAHVISNKHRGNKFFNEGLAEFFQDKFGEDAGGITYYKEPQYLSLDDLVIKYKDSLISLYYLKHKNDVFGVRNKSENRKLAYIEAGSFIKFLYEKYGEHKLQDFYHSRNLDYEKVYGRNINDLEAEWLNYVFIELPAKEPKAADAQRIEISKTFIMVQQPDNIYEYGKVIYKVNSGDVLEVVKSKTCRSGYGECWIVRNIETGMTGIISAKRAKARHQIKTEKVPLK